MRNGIAVLALCALLGGCMTSRTWEEPDAEVIQRKVKTGDDATIVARNGKTYRLEVTAVGEDALHGIGGGKRFKIMYSMIDSIHVERGHAWPAGVGVGVIATGVVVGALIAAFDNMEQQNWDLCGGN